MPAERNVKPDLTPLYTSLLDLTLRDNLDFLLTSFANALEADGVAFVKQGKDEFSLISCKTSDKASTVLFREELSPKILEKFSEKYTSSAFEHLNDKNLLLKVSSERFFKIVPLPVKLKERYFLVFLFSEESGAEKFSAELKQLFAAFTLKLSTENYLEEILGQVNSLVHSLDEAVWVYNVETNQITFGSKIEEMLGFDHGELGNTPEQLEKLVFTEQTYELLEKTRKTLQKPVQQLTIETSLMQKDGKYRWFWGNVRFFYHEDKLRSVMGTLFDISDKKTMEISLEKSQEYYEKLLNNLGEVVFNTDEKGNILYLNKSWQRLTGLKAEECLNTSIQKYFFLPDNKRSRMPELKTAGTEPMELMVKHKNGNDRWVQLNIRPLFLYANKVGGYTGSIFDIHDSKIAHLKILENEQTFRIITENSQDVVALQSAKGKLLYISPSVNNYMEQDADHVKANFESFKKDSPLSKEMRKDLLKNEKSLSLTHKLKNREGKEVWLETVFTSFYSPLQKELLILSTSRDISTRMAMEEEMKRSLEREKELNKLKSDFIDMATHEFKSPLTSIKSSMQLLQMGMGQVKEKSLRESFEKHTDRVATQVNRINGLMDQIFAIGKIEKGNVTLKLVETDLEVFVKEIIHDALQYAGEKNAEIEISTKGDVKNIRVDNFILYHILFNLLSNALKYSKGKPFPKISIEFLKKSIIFAVKDFGIGIPEEEQKNLFQSFFRATNALTVPGTGLGLVIVKNFTDILGGEIQVQSKLNKGTLIKVNIPAN